MRPAQLELPPPADHGALTRRGRHSARLNALRTTLATLDRAVPVVLTLGDADDDVEWGGFLDKKALRVRRLMRQSTLLAEEAKQLETARRQLQHVLHERQVASRVLAGLLQDLENDPIDQWQRDVRRWCRLTRQHFRPWTKEMCQVEMQAALKEVDGFQWSQEKQTTGVSFLGWRDWRRIDHSRGAFQFEFHKTFRGFDVDDYRKVAWDTVKDPETCYKVNIGPSARIVDGLAVGHLGSAHLEVLQQLHQDTVITRLSRRHPALGIDVHIVYLGFRLKTDTGYTQYSRPICCPELIEAFNGPKDVWASNSLWCKWEILKERDYNLSLGGSVSAKSVEYAQQWMLEALACVLRAERMATRRGLLTTE